MDQAALFFAPVCAVIVMTFLALNVFRRLVPTPDPRMVAASIHFRPVLFGLIKPEPVENLTFVFGVGAAAVLSIAMAWMSVRRPAAAGWQSPVRVIAVLGALASAAWLVRMDWSTLLSPAPSVLLRSPFQHPRAFLLFGLIAGACAWFLSAWDRRLPVILATVVPLVYLASNILVRNGEGYTQSIHFEVFSYPIFQDWLGSGLYLGHDGQKSQYGMYPVLLHPIWSLIGAPSPSAIGAVMFVLQFLSTLALVVFMARYSRNPALGGAFALAGVLVAQLLYMFWPADAYFEFFPIRLVFPGLAFVLLSWRPTRERLQFLSYVILAPGLFWNFESGLVALGTYASFTMASAFTPSLRSVSALAARHAVMGLGAVAIATLGLEADYLLRFGATPNLVELVRSILTFSSGAGAEPMPPFGAWGIHCLIYMLSAFVAFRSLWRGSQGEERRRAAALLAVAVAGTLWLRYYQGRSLPLPLCLVSAPLILAVGLMIDQATTRLKSGARISTAVAIMVASLFLGSFGAWMIGKPAPNRHFDTLIKHDDVSPLLGPAAKIVDQFNAIRTSPGDRLLLLSSYASYVYAHLGVPSPIRSAGMCQIWYQSEVDDAVSAALRPETKMAVIDTSRGCGLSTDDERPLGSILQRDYVEYREKSPCGGDLPLDGPKIYLRKGLAPLLDGAARFDGAPDLAQGKPATQISTFGDAAAGRAVDGNACGDYARNSVAHTDLAPAPWWQVDLGANAMVRSVQVWNRSDCCSERLSRFWVFVSDQPFQPNDTPAILKARPGVWGARVESSPSPDRTISVGRRGRFVRIQLEDQNWLALAEVKVFGE